MGQSELSMSMTCLARTPCGVLVLIRIPVSPALAGGAALGAQPLAERTRPALSSSAAALLALGFRTGNVQHNLELQQGRARGHRIAMFPPVRLDGRTRGPGLERLFGLPLRDDEIAVLPLDRAQ